jgi:hypothetical protein
VSDEPKPPVNLRELKRQPSPHLIAALEELLAAAKSGDLVGCAFLCNGGEATSALIAGSVNWGDMLASFEDLKFNMLLERNITIVGGNG